MDVELKINANDVTRENIDNFLKRVHELACKYGCEDRKEEVNDTNKDS